MPILMEILLPPVPMHHLWAGTIGRESLSYLALSIVLVRLIKIPPF